MNLADQLEEIPPEPGLYFFWTHDRECLYIGQSVNLQKRLNHHLESYRDYKHMRSQMDYDDPEMEQYAIESYAKQPIHAHMDAVQLITVKLLPHHRSSLQIFERRFIKAMLPRYNEAHKYRPKPGLVLRCPECNRQLKYKKTAGTCGGYVCRNYDCRHYWKLGNGNVVEVVEK